MQSYHLVWLSAHPDRTASWLAERLLDGFHIHHVDGDHSNDEPSNLVLMEGADHMRLHGQMLVDGIKRWRAKPKGFAKEENNADDGGLIYEAKAAFSGGWADFAEYYFNSVKPRDTRWSNLGAVLAGKARRHAGREKLQWPPDALPKPSDMPTAVDVAAYLSRLRNG